MRTLLMTLPAAAPQRIRLSRPLSAFTVERAAAIAQRLRNALRTLWRYAAFDERTAYLSQATDHADLERRLRAWDEHLRDRLRWPPTL
jgi:hypothetical protein